jgi:carboxyl-terminal processing protease
MHPWVVRGMLAALVGVALGVAFSHGSPGVPASRDAGADALAAEDTRLLAEVLERVRREYVDRIDEEALVEAAIRGVIADLDPHSAFLGPAEFSDIRISTSGRYSGIGIEMATDGERIVVVAPVDGGPADRAGIRAGDIIVEVDGLLVGAADLEHAVRRLRGASGTTVRLAVRREGVDAPLAFELQRGPVALTSVRAELLEGGDAYARISHFTDATPAELHAALRKLEQAAGRPLPGLVLDLRSNPGGVLEAGIEVADMFLDHGLIVSAEGRLPESRFRAHATAGDVLNGAPLVLLVNQGSASAAEIVAGALKDQGRAALVGTRTFGKGSVQTIMPLSAGRAIKLTTARYYTPSGLSIQARGVMPDLVVENVPDAQRDRQLAAAVAALFGHRPVAAADVVALHQGSE